MKGHKTFSFFFLLVFLLAPAGCKSTGFTPYVDTGERVTRAEVLTEARLLLPGVPVQGLDDSVYTVVDATWLVANLNNFRAWAWEYLPNYQGQALDCENFARILREVVNVQAGGADVPASPLIAVVYVEQRNRWANVPGSATARHAVNGVVTTHGIYIVEPQSLTGREPTWAPLADYPNPIFLLQF